MLKLAVVGKDVSKSESGKMHAFILRGMGSDCEYEHISVAAEKFDALAEKLLAEKDAFNVTIPYKLSVIPHLNSLEGDAKIFGAVNTVKDRIGYNTDGAGFMLMLQNNGIETSGRRFLVLGAGGAGRSVVKKLADAGAHVFLYDMNVQNAEIVATEFGNIRPLASLQPAQYDVIVGAEFLSRCNLACDLIYCPKKSEFLRIAEGLGKKILNGEGMLFYQAYYADCIYLGKDADPEEAKTLFERYQREKENA